MSRKDRIYLRVQKGSLVPADSLAEEQIRSRGYTVGQIVQVEIFKLRSQAFNRLAHRIGCLVADNIEAFHGMDAHKALKRLQIESGAACDEIGISIPGFGMCIQKIPRSFSFEAMSEDEYKDSIKKMCDYVSERYWPTISPEKIAEMAESWVN